VSYPIPKSLNQAEIEIKKSRFIALATHIVSREAGMAWLAEIKARYPDARHHCWAYLVGNPHCATNAGMGDDGEPSGTAGKPILNVLQHKGIGDIMIIVVRYFGGIKLGAGGLTRAYGQAAQAVMTDLVVEEYMALTRIEISCDYGQEQQIRHWLTLLHGEVVSVDYAAPVKIHARVPDADMVAFIKQLESLQKVSWEV
jgi:uncharacterized YigZ family protein